MEDQEHKISSYIEQQEDMKSMVSSFKRMCNHILNEYFRITVVLRSY